MVIEDQREIDDWAYEVYYQKDVQRPITESARGIDQCNDDADELYAYY